MGSEVRLSFWLYGILERDSSCCFQNRQFNEYSVMRASRYGNSKIIWYFNNFYIFSSILTRSHVTNYNQLQILPISCVTSISWKFVDYPAMECKFYPILMIQTVVVGLVAKMSICVIDSIWLVAIKDIFRLAQNAQELRTATA